MRTNLLPGSAADTAWLEFDVTGKEPERIELERLPFTLGRNESCDYQIPSSRVSREHAEIVREAGVLKLRDLKSTNGTFVNGQRIDQHRLVDGDLVVIADVRFTVRTNHSESIRKTVTQVMPQATAASARAEDPARDLIYTVRRTQEALLHRAARICFHPVCDLTENHCIGFESGPRATAHAGDQVLESTDCRLMELTSQLHRLVAAEQFARLPAAKLLFFKLQPSEVGADLLPQSLSRLTTLAGRKKVVVGIPDNAVVDIPYFRDFCGKLRELDIGVAFDGFAGSPNQIKTQAGFAPDYLKLAPALVRGIDKSTQRQQQMKALVEALRDTSIQLIATGVHSENEACTCRELGFRLAQGDHFNHTRTSDRSLESLSQSA